MLIYIFITVIFVSSTFRLQSLMKPLSIIIMYTSIGAKLFICKLDYCLKVDESSTNAKKNGICDVFALNFQ